MTGHDHRDDRAADEARHLDDLALSRLAERAVRGDPVREEVPHVFRCRRCFATFAEFVRAHAAWATGRADRVPTPEWLAAARAVATDGPRAGRRDPASDPREPGGTTFRRARRAWLTGAAAALAAVLAGVVILTDEGGPGRRPGGDWTAAAIEAAMREDSRHGLVHFGHATLEPGAARPTYRSGMRGTTSAARDELDALADLQRDRAPTADEASGLVAGHLALSQLDKAAVFLVEAERLYPRDPRFAHLAAHLAFKTSDLRRSRELWERIVADRPDDGVARLNLGLVLRELGDPGADALLRDVRERCAGTFLAERAGSALSESR